VNIGRFRHTSLPLILATAILVAFSATGLMAGSLTFKVTSSLAAHPPAQPATSSPTATASVTTGTSSSSPTAVPSRTITQSFRLDLSATPNPIQTGQRLAITIQASDNFTHAAIGGLACSLENPEDGGSPLLTAWPGPAVTNADGQAAWNIELPPTAPGIYEIGFSATGAHGYRYHGQVSISVASAG
jgi:hypothetical protein